jgi:tripartite ATP-independent transporter DctM subunit
MEWWLLLLLIFSSTVLLFLLEVPVAFSFLFINVVGFTVFMGGDAGLKQLVLSLYESVSTFVLLPVPLFILMGEVMFRSGVANNMINALDKWLGGVPGRLGLLSVAAGTIFATLSGSSMASSAMLGSVLVPEMEKKNYKPEMTVGPIMGSGGLAIMIPPSVLGVTLAAMGRFSVGDFLVAIIVPGLLMALAMALYIIIRCRFRPDLAPRYETAALSLREKIMATVTYVLPLGSIVFLCVGLIFCGVATPSEAAALGALGCFGIAFVYRGLRWEVIKISVMQTVRLSTMLLMIITGAMAFSQLLAYTGASQGLVELASGLPLPRIFVVVLMLIILLLLGCFMESITIIMITIPVFMPIVRSLAIDPIWFGVIMLISLEMGAVTPPFGMVLYVMKGVAPHLPMQAIIKAGVPFILCHLLVIILVMAFPFFVSWLPSFMH